MLLHVFDFDTVTLVTVSSMANLCVFVFGPGPVCFVASLLF